MASTCHVLGHPCMHRAGIWPTATKSPRPNQHPHPPGRRIHAPHLLLDRLPPPPLLRCGCGVASGVLPPVVLAGAPALLVLGAADVDGPAAPAAEVEALIAALLLEPAIERRGPCTPESTLLLPVASVWLSIVCATPTKMWVGVLLKLSSCTVHLCRPDAKVVLPVKSMGTPLPLFNGAGVVGWVWYLMHVSSSARVTSGSCELLGLYQVNSGLGVTASCREMVMPAHTVTNGYIWSAEMELHGSDCCITTVSFSRSVATMTGCLSSRGARSMVSTSPVFRLPGTPAVHTMYSCLREVLSTEIGMVGDAPHSTRAGDPTGAS